jgi:hypothetical protein
MSDWSGGVRLVCGMNRGTLRSRVSTLDSNLCCVQSSSESRVANLDRSLIGASDFEFCHSQSTRTQNQSGLRFVCMVGSSRTPHSWTVHNDVGHDLARISGDSRLALRLVGESNNRRSLSVLTSRYDNGILGLSQHAISRFNEETTGLLGRKSRDFGRT